MGNVRENEDYILTFKFKLCIIFVGNGNIIMYKIPQEFVRIKNNILEPRSSSFGKTKKAW